MMADGRLATGWRLQLAWSARSCLVLIYLTTFPRPILGMSMSEAGGRPVAVTVETKVLIVQETGTRWPFG